MVLPDCLGNIVRVRHGFVTRNPVQNDERQHGMVAGPIESVLVGRNLPEIMTQAGEQGIGDHHRLFHTRCKVACNRQAVLPKRNLGQLLKNVLIIFVLGFIFVALDDGRAISLVIEDGQDILDDPLLFLLHGRKIDPVGMKLLDLFPLVLRWRRRFIADFGSDSPDPGDIPKIKHISFSRPESGDFFKQPVFLHCPLGPLRKQLPYGIENQNKTGSSSSQQDQVRQHDVLPVRGWP